MKVRVFAKALAVVLLSGLVSGLLAIVIPPPVCYGVAALVGVVLPLSLTGWVQS